MRLLYIRVCQIICPTMVAGGPHKYSTSFSAFYFYQRLTFWKSQQNYILSVAKYY